MKNLDIIKYSWVWLSISGALVIGSLVAVAVCGLNFGIDFTGGSLLEVRGIEASVEDVREAVEETGHEATVQESDTGAYFIRLSPITEEEHQEVLSAIKALSPNAEEIKFDSVGPSVGRELTWASAKALVLLLILIGAYVAWAFRKVSVPVASWKYGVVTSVTAFAHDVVVPIGAFAILGKVVGYQIDTAFVAATLTVLGYSINDKIVVFDRIRENLFRHRFGDTTFEALVNKSILETMGRSINTSLATLLPLTAIFFMGGETTRPFVLVLIIGILSGAYSSIFVASPLLVQLERWGRK